MKGSTRLKNIRLPMLLTVLLIPHECPAAFGKNSAVGKMMSDVSKIWRCVTTKEGNITPNEKNVLFRLYTRGNKHRAELLAVDYGEEVETLRLNMLRKKRSAPLLRTLSKEAIIRSEKFVLNADTKILIHGYAETLSNTRMMDIKDVYLETGDYNVIVVDWGILANRTCYVHAVRAVSKVGDMIGRLIDQLILSGVALTSIHIIGFSLGAHVAGMAGKNVELGIVKRITGLDPALPMFVTEDTAKRLHRTDAAYVDVIHTCAGTLGLKAHIGHADFYPNGGSEQSGCSDVGCSHSRAPLYYLESVRRPAAFRAARCDSWSRFLHGDCYSNPHALMGAGSDPRSRGDFYLKTSNSTPYCSGVEKP